MTVNYWHSNKQIRVQIFRLIDAPKSALLCPELGRMLNDFSTMETIKGRCGPAKVHLPPTLLEPEGPLKSELKSSFSKKLDLLCVIYFLSQVFSELLFQWLVDAEWSLFVHTSR